MSPTLLYCDGDHRDLLVLTHAFPTRLSSDLDAPSGIAAPAPGTRLKARRTAIASHSRSSIRHRPAIGRAHVCTPVTNSHLVCRLLLEKKNSHRNYITRYLTCKGAQPNINSNLIIHKHNDAANSQPQPT